MREGSHSDLGLSLRLPHRLHFVDFQVIDDARLLLQTQLQTLTAGGQGYFSSDIADSPIYKDFR